VWRTDDNQLWRKLSGATGDLILLRFAVDSRTLAAVSRSTNDVKTVMLWNLDSGSPAQRLSVAGEDRVLDVQPDSGQVALWGDKEELRIWSLNEGVVRIKLTGHDYDVN